MGEMTPEKFRDFIRDLPEDKCDSCYWNKSHLCPKGKEWFDSEERKQNRILYDGECETYKYWQERYAELGWDRFRIMDELEMEYEMDDK